jgi:hypothetical protein
MNERLEGTRLRVSTAVVLAVAAGVITWLLVDRTGDSSTPSATVQPSPGGRTVVALSPHGLKTLSGALHHPIYWVGPKPGYTYEVTQTPSNGNIYVRYLPLGVKVNDSRPNFLIIGTYPLPNAFQALKRTAQGREISLSDGGIAVVDQPYPKSVHMALPGLNFEIEVYDPSPRRSLAIAISGTVRPVS